LVEIKVIGDQRLSNAEYKPIAKFLMKAPFMMTPYDGNWV